MSLFMRLKEPWLDLLADLFFLGPGVNVVDVEILAEDDVEVVAASGSFGQLSFMLEKLRPDLQLMDPSPIPQARAPAACPCLDSSFRAWTTEKVNNS